MKNNHVERKGFALFYNHAQLKWTQSCVNLIVLYSHLQEALVFCQIFFPSVIRYMPGQEVSTNRAPVIVYSFF